MMKIISEIDIIESESMQNKQFISPTMGKLTVEETITEIVKFFGEDPTVSYNLVIGSDSKVRRENGVQTVDFVTAIVIHRRGKGARYFWLKNKIDKVYSLRDKIYHETLFSLDLAQELVPILKDKLVGFAPYDLEIHIDVGEAGPTREMIKEVVGLVTGNGFVAKTKPEGYGAYVVADKHT
jgi:predicted RNase H-related nuclease YkuK (DUF458 family)